MIKHRIKRGISMNTILIYQQNVKDTYLYFIKDTLSLIKTINNDRNGHIEPYNPARKERLYLAKAKHIQMMTLLGLTAEHLVKIVLLKRGYILNTKQEAKFPKELMELLEKENEKGLTQESLDMLYKKAQSSIPIKVNKNLMCFDKCINLFNMSNTEDYYSSIGTYSLSSEEEGDDKEEYFGYQQISPSDAFRVIQQMRNSYIHLSEAQEEQNGVVWYLYNFEVWLCKREYPDFFTEVDYIGSEYIKKMFKSNPTLR